jgi:hypothetical protein
MSDSHNSDNTQVSKAVASKCQYCHGYVMQLKIVLWVSLLVLVLAADVLFVYGPQSRPEMHKISARP